MGTRLRQQPFSPGHRHLLSVSADEDEDDNDDGPDRIVDAEAWVHQRFGDPEAEALPHDVGDEEPPLRDYSEVAPDRDTMVSFWAAVIYANVGLFLVAVGPMLWYFRGQATLGAAMVVIGSLAFVRVYTVYRAYIRRREERDRRARARGDSAVGSDGDGGDDNRDGGDDNRDGGDSQ